MARRLEKLAEASNNLFSKAVVGTTISLAALTISPEKAEGQNETVCENEKGDNKPLISRDGGYYHVNYYVQGNSDGFYIQDDLVTSYDGKCVSYNLDNALRRSHNGEPAFVLKGSSRSTNSSDGSNARNRRNTRSQSDFDKAINTANDVANIVQGVDAIIGLFSGNNNSSNNSEKSSSNQERNYQLNPNRAEDSPYVDNSSGSDQQKQKSSGSPYENESANVRNSQGERHESPYVSDNKSLSGESLYETEDKKDGSERNSDVLYETSQDDWVGGNAPPLEPHERRAKEFFGGVKINTSSRTMYEVGLISRTAAYDLVSWVPYVGDAKDAYVDHLSTKNKTDAADYWRGKLLPEKVEESLDRLDRKTVDYRETSTVNISF